MCKGKMPKYLTHRHIKVLMPRELFDAVQLEACRSGRTMSDVVFAFAADGINALLDASRHGPAGEQAG